MKTLSLGLAKPDADLNVVSGNAASGQSNEAANEDILDTAVAGLGGANTASGCAIEAHTTSGAISLKAGTVTLGSAGALTMTLANPVSGTDDGKELSIIAVTAHAHIVTTTAGISGGANHKATFGGALADQLNLVALGGVWYLRPSTNQTLTAS
jgi:hypothetical protein